MRVLPREDEERVVRRTRAGEGASVREVGPLAWEVGVVVVIVDLVISDDCIRGGGSRMEFCNR